MNQTPSRLFPAASLARSARRSAFTLIEVLIVIGVIALLVSIAVIGFKVVGGVSRDRVTDTALENAKSLFAEFKLTNTPESLLGTDLVTAMTASPTYRWQANSDGLNNDVLHCSVRAPAFSPTPASPGDGGLLASPDARAVQDRYLRDETARVIRRLMSVPSNRRAIESMPPDRVVRVKYPADPAATLTVGGDTPEYATTVTTVDGVDLLDGHNHPIYFIPGGGLSQVNVGYQGKGDKDDSANYDRAKVLVQSPDHQPFWASPGADGDLTTGDDNVYSFGR